MPICAAVLAGITAVTVPVKVEVGVTVPLALVAWTLREANAIWEEVGIQFDPQLEGVGNSRLRVLIDEDTVNADDTETEKRIGWVMFSASEATPTIHLSYRSASALLHQAEMLGAVVPARTTMMRNVVVGRALGRALAHELVHVLLSSKNHTTTGLMRRKWPLVELFSYERWNMNIQASASEKTAMLAAAQARSRD